jgi:VanZ family protein
MRGRNATLGRARVHPEHASATAAERRRATSGRRPAQTLAAVDAMTRWRAWLVTPVGRHVVRWTAVVLWAGIIFYLSSLPGTAFPIRTTLLAKLVHLTEYTVLTALLVHALDTHSLRRGRGESLAAALALAYAISDEVHQSFVPHRHPSALDVMIDASGIGAVALIAVMRQRSRNREPGGNPEE